MLRDVCLYVSECEGSVTFEGCLCMPQCKGSQMLTDVCLCQSVNVLDEEENADKQLRTSHGARWTRTPSERLTESIRAEAARYRQIIDNAVNADGIVRQRYAEHREGFELLSRSDVSVCVWGGGVMSCLTIWQTSLTHC